MDDITINELIKILGGLPTEAKEMKIYEICGCVDDKDRIPGFRFILKMKIEKANTFLSRRTGIALCMILLEKGKF